MWNDPSPPLRPKGEPRSLDRMTAPTHYGYTTFPGIEKIYRFGFKEVNTGFRPTLELIEIGSAPRQDADTWTYHPCVPDNRLPQWRVGNHLMAAHIRVRDNSPIRPFVDYTITYRIDGVRHCMSLKYVD